MSFEIIDELIENEDKIEVRETEYGTFYYKNYQLHRENGPASISKTNKTKCWYWEGLVHRDDGPAIEYNNGFKVWCKHGVMHRLDGPAIVRSEGLCEWWIDGKNYTETEYNIIISQL